MERDGRHVYRECGSEQTDKDDDGEDIHDELRVGENLHGSIGRGVCVFWAVATGYVGLCLDQGGLRASCRGAECVAWSWEKTIGMGRIFVFPDRRVSGHLCVGRSEHEAPVINRPGSSEAEGLSSRASRNDESYGDPLQPCHIQGTHG